MFLQILFSSFFRCFIFNFYFLQDLVCSIFFCFFILFIILFGWIHCTAISLSLTIYCTELESWMIITFMHGNFSMNKDLIWVVLAFCRNCFLRLPYGTITSTLFAVSGLLISIVTILHSTNIVDRLAHDLLRRKFYW